MSKEKEVYYGLCFIIAMLFGLNLGIVIIDILKNYWGFGLNFIAVTIDGYVGYICAVNYVKEASKENDKKDS